MRKAITTDALEADAVYAIRQQLGEVEAVARFFRISPRTWYLWEERGVRRSEVIKGALRCLALDHLGDFVRMDLDVASYLAWTNDTDVSPLRVHRLRKRLGWTQEVLGAFFGVSYSTPAVWESKHARLDAATQGAIVALEQHVKELDRLDERERRPRIARIAEQGVSQFLVQRFYPTA